MWKELIQQIQSGNMQALARAISLIENDYPGYQELLRLLPDSSTAQVIGITGPPGAGKSTLTDALATEFINRGKRVGILCVDPSSAFHLGALLGDRIRMTDLYNNQAAFIRSLASRGSMGGLSPRIIEITDLMKAAGFDIVFIETVGVGQSEIEIAGLADLTVVVMVPEAGDDVQTMKAGLMEIADIFVVNKCDRPGADLFVQNLKSTLSPVSRDANREIPVLKTAALMKEGIHSLYEVLNKELINAGHSEKKYWLLAERAWQLISNRRMSGLSKTLIKEAIEKELSEKNFNLYEFISRY